MDDFSSMQQQIQFDGMLGRARTFLDAGDYDAAIREAKRAQGMTGVNGIAEASSILAAAQEAKKRRDADLKERKRREDEDRQKQEELERLVAEEEEKRRQAEQQAGIGNKSKSAKNLHVLSVVVLIAEAVLVYGSVFFSQNDNHSVEYITSFKYWPVYVFSLLVVLFYSYAASNHRGRPLGVFVLSVIWSAIICFIIASARIFQSSQYDLTWNWGVFIRFMIPCLIVSVIGALLGRSSRQVRLR